MKKNIQDKLCSALLARGATETKPTSKYRCFTHTNGLRHFVGRKGSLRVGRTVTESFPVNKAVYDALLKEGSDLPNLKSAIT